MKQSKDYQNALSATRKELHEMEIGKGMWPAIQYANQMLRDLVQRDGFREDAVAHYDIGFPDTRRIPVSDGWIE